MKLLLFEWPSVTNPEMANVLTDMGIEVHIVRIPFKRYCQDTELCDKMEETLEKDHFDVVFSINYFDMIAEACHRKKIKYIAWTYDSPTNMGDPQILKYETNYVFLFDRKEAETWQSRGFDNVYYLPLAVNYKRYDNIYLTNKELKILQSDISFVGKLYSSTLPEMLASLSDYSKAYINALVDAQTQIYGYNLLKEIITPEFMEFIGTPEFNRRMNTPEKLPWDTSDELLPEPSEDTPHPGALIMKLNGVITNRERVLLVGLLSRHFHFKLFSNQKHSIVKTAYLCGPADYYKDMPRVFKASKINLNISLRSIESAIPLRCLDIMACGGLLMSNFQPELFDHFEENKDLLIYHNPEDALEKARYYLDSKHEAERLKIAQNGYEKVKNYYNYPKQLDFIWEKAGLKHLL